MAEILVEIIRGSLVEGLHTGHIAVVDTRGTVLYSVGDADRVTYFRSAAKPLLALATLKVGIHEVFKLSPKEIAIISASHSGEKIHSKVLYSIMKKLDIEIELLKCGVHPPLDKDTEKQLYSSGEDPSPIHCNCSGKHLGIIAACKIMGFSTHDYYLPSHPIQDVILKVVSDFCNINLNKIIRSIDGCGLPVYAVPLKNMALAYANLTDFDFMNGKYSDYQRILTDAMTDNPEMVGGTNKRIDTELMTRFGERLISKVGAEGAHCSGLLGRKMGTALKIEDGSLRAIDPVVVETLYQVGILSLDDVKLIKDYHTPPVINHRKEKVGELRPVFKLTKVQN